MATTNGSNGTPNGTNGKGGGNGSGNGSSGASRTRGASRTGGRSTPAGGRSSAVIVRGDNPATPPEDTLASPDLGDLGGASEAAIKVTPAGDSSAAQIVMPVPPSVQDAMEGTDGPATSSSAPPPPSGIGGKVKGFLGEYKPSTVTGGAPALPLMLLAGINLVDGFDVAAYNVLLPEIRDYFGVSLTFIGTLSTFTSLLGLVLAIPIGYLSDRVNRLWMVIFGAALTGTMAIMTAFSWSFAALATFRFGAGMGRVVAPAEQVLLADFYPPDSRAKVFSFNQVADRVGAFAGPLVAGFLGSLLFWQAPFLVVGIPVLVFGLLMALKLREPVRGEQERRAMGATEEEATTREPPPSWTEAWRIAKSVRTLRLIWFSLPFTVAAGRVAAQLMPIYYDEIFGLGPGARGVIAAFDEPFSIAGILVGGVFANRFLRHRPGRAMTYLSIVSMISALSLALVAISPFLFVAVGLSFVRAFAFAVFLPTQLAVTTMIIPARVRGFALSASLVFVAPGLLVGPLLFSVADRIGTRAGLLMVVPIFFIGAAIISAAGSTVESDIRAARAAAMAGAVSRKSKEEGSTKLLVVRDLDVAYDQVQILFNVDFEVEEGEVIALLGTNGAGKSTLLRAISGTTTAANGAIFFDGEDITFLPPSAHAARGIIQVPGGKGIFPSLTVAENLKLAAWLYRNDDEYVKAATASVLERFPSLERRLNEAAGNMSGGEQQMLTLGQAFLSRPRLLMIDELSLGLAPAIVEQLLGIVKAIADAGTTIILVEQSVNVALTVARRAVFMEKGEIRFSGPTEELMARPDILRSVYLKGAGGGGPIVQKARGSLLPGSLAPGTALEVRDIVKSFGGIRAIPGVSLTLEENKILGLIGPNGAGKTTLFDIISGFVKPDAGQILLFDEDVTDLAPDQRAKVGLARSFQDARLFPSLTVTENLQVALERHLTSRSTIGAALHLPMVAKAEKSIERRMERLIKLMNLNDFRDKFVRELSTGSRRIVDLACVMACEPRVLLLDEPSSGIAQREAEELGPLLLRIKAETGCSILIIEHDMPLICSVSDELLALDLGAAVTRGTPEQVLEHPKVIQSYLGTTDEVINRSGELS